MALTPTLNTTHKSKRFSGYATITHPFHPKCGKQFKILFTREKQDRDTFCLTEDGSETITVLRDWTDRADDTDLSDLGLTSTNTDSTDLSSTVSSFLTGDVSLFGVDVPGYAVAGGAALLFLGLWYALAD